MTSKRKSTTVQNLNTSNGVPMLRENLSRCVGKICAYKNVGKDDEAKLWARNLIGFLQNAKLIEPISS